MREPLQSALESELDKIPGKQILTIRITAREHYLIKQAAKHKCTSINQWCRDELVSAAEIEFAERKGRGELPV
jgi:uncharacterized protein (DUF1778 family)